MNQIHPEPLSGTLVDILEETAARYPEHGIFHVASGDTSEEFQSYPELLRNAKEMAQVLYRRGLRPRTPLILSVDASRTFLEIFWGCLFSGVLPAPLAHMRTPKADSRRRRFFTSGRQSRLPSWPIRPTSGPLPC